MVFWLSQNVMYCVSVWEKKIMAPCLFNNFRVVMLEKSWQNFSNHITIYGSSCNIVMCTSFTVRRLRKHNG